MKLVFDLFAAQSPGSSQRGIGRFAFSLARTMADRRGAHEFHLLLSAAYPDALERIREEFLDVLPERWIHAWEPVRLEAGDPDSWRYRQGASQLIREAVLRRLEPDWVLVGTLFESWRFPGVGSIGRLARGPRTAALFYDLIPYERRSLHLRRESGRDQYRNRLRQLQRADLLLAISEFTKREALAFLGRSEESVVVIPGDASPHFQPPASSEDMGDTDLKQKYGIPPGFLLATSGVYEHKNVPGLFRAFARLPAPIRRRHRLVLVCALHERNRATWCELARNLGVQDDEFFLTGYVSDEDLVRFYAQCRLFVVPSFLEGFGLPVLEAMRCGAPVIGSSTGSLPEVIGWSGALLDPFNEGEMSDRILQGLTDEAYREKLREVGREQAMKFSWKNSADAAWRAVEEHSWVPVGGAEAGSAPVPCAVEDLRIACVVPEGEMLAPRLRGRLEPFAEVEVFSPEAAELQVNLPFGLEERRESGFRSLLGSGFDLWLVVASPRMPLEFLVDFVERVPVLLWCEAEEAWADQPEKGGFREEKEWSGLLGKAFAWVQDSPQAAEEASVRAWEGRHGRSFKMEPGPDPSMPETTLADFLRTLAREALADPRQVAAAVAAQEGRAPGERARQDVAEAIAGNLPRLPRLPRLFIDVSELARRDAGTGVQRVVRNILRALRSSPPEDYRVELVRTGKDGRYWRAGKYFAQGLPEEGAERFDRPVEACAGDVFLGLDLALPQGVRCRDTLRNWRWKGVTVVMVVYDLLPQRMPDCFLEATVEWHRKWLDVVAEQHGAVCISRTVATSVRDWMEREKGGVPRSLTVDSFRLGSDDWGELETKGRVVSASTQVPDSPHFLMVGTVEPRKGHALVLDAFERLWAEGKQWVLVIVGGRGWNCDALLSRMDDHPEAGRLLQWSDSAGDDVLAAWYRHATGLLAASTDEGFGLPIVEAARCNLPALVRDIPVFREVGVGGVSYFRSRDGTGLAEEISAWVDRYRAGQLPSPQEVPVVSWERSASDLLTAVRRVVTKTGEPRPSAQASVV